MHRNRLHRVIPFRGLVPLHRSGGNRGCPHPLRPLAGADSPSPPSRTGSVLPPEEATGTPVNGPATRWDPVVPIAVMQLPDRMTPPDASSAVETHHGVRGQRKRCSNRRLTLYMTECKLNMSTGIFEMSNELSHADFALSGTRSGRATLPSRRDSAMTSAFPQRSERRARGTIGRCGQPPENTLWLEEGMSPGEANRLGFIRRGLSRDETARIVTEWVVLLSRARGSTVPSRVLSSPNGLSAGR